MLFHEQPTDPWVPFDFLLIQAYQILQDETCAECGNPIWICRNEDAQNVGFKVKIARCFAKAELDKWHDQQEKQKKKAAPGEYPYVVAYTYDGSDFPSRKQFYKGLSDKIE